MLTPRVVAHVGASETGLYQADVFRSLLASKATVYPVNPNRDLVFGERCYGAITELPERPDLAVVTVRRELVSEVLAGCVSAGVPGAVVFASGFAEAGAEGAGLQRQIAAFADRVVILGPNCAGFANVGDGIVATRLYSKLRPGSVSFVSQSGALMMALHGSFSDAHVGLRYIASVGNQVDLTVSDLLLHFAEDDQTRLSALFLEGVSDGGRLVAALERNLQVAKPVIVLRAGRTEAGRVLASTHTAAIAGSDRVFSAVCRQYGAVLVDDVNDMVAAARLFEAFGARLTDRVAYLCQSGGLGSLAGDLAKLARLEASAFSDGLRERIQAAGIVPQYREALNPLDVGGDAMRGKALIETAVPFFEDTETDAVALLFAKNPNRPVEQETAAAVVELAVRYEKPLIVIWVGDFTEEGSSSAIATIEQNDIPVFRQPSDAVQAVSRVVEYYRFRRVYFAEGDDARAS